MQKHFCKPCIIKQNLPHFYTTAKIVDCLLTPQLSSWIMYAFTIVWAWPVLLKALGQNTISPTFNSIKNLFSSVKANLNAIRPRANTESDLYSPKYWFTN